MMQNIQKRMAAGQYTMFVHVYRQTPVDVQFINNLSQHVHAGKVRLLLNNS